MLPYIPMRILTGLSAFGVQSRILLILAAKSLCLPQRCCVLSVTSRKVNASKDEAGGAGDPVSGYSPAGKEESW
jgi:hypothetical protein